MNSLGLSTRSNHAYQCGDRLPPALYCRTIRRHKLPPFAPCPHKRRRRQTRYGQGRRVFPGRIDIDARPQVVAARSRFGDWEADLICASKGKAALVSCNERKSRFLLLGKVEDKKAASFNASLIPRLCKIPAALRKTLTLDNGSEMAGFKELEPATEMSTYSRSAE